MKFDEKYIKVLGVIKGGAKSFGTIKSRSMVEAADLEKILQLLEIEHLITSKNSKGFFGQPTISASITDSGSKMVDDYVNELKEKWKEVITLAADGDRKKLDEYLNNKPNLAKEMLFFGVINLPALSRLNLRFLLEGKHLCYNCKRELKKYSQKFTVKHCKKFNFQIPKGMTENDDLCADCFDKLKSNVI